MGTKTDPRRSRGQRRGLATFVSFLLLFAFALGQSSISALADDGSTDPVASEEAAPDGSRLPAADAPAEEAPAADAPAEEAPAEEPPADAPADVPASEATGSDAGASSGGGAASLSSDGSESSAKSNTRSARNVALVGAAAAPATGLAGGDIDLDFVAAGPFTYDHSTGVGPNPPFGFNDRTISKTTGVVESLESGDFECDDLVTFFTEIIVDDGAAGGGTIELDYAFDRSTTGQDGILYTDIIDSSVAVNTADDANVDSGTAASASLVAENTATDPITGTVEITGLDPGDTIIVRMSVRLDCIPGSTPTGNLLAAITDARVTAPEEDNIPVGNQTVPMKATGFVAAPAVVISKSCPETALVGEDITFEITITNNGNDDLEQVVVTDSVDGGTAVTVPGFPSTLAAGASFTGNYVYTPTGNEDDPLTNTATVTAVGVVSDTTVTDTSIECDTDILHPEITVTKSCTDFALVGDTITYTITVENTGDEDLEDITVDDSLLGDLSSSFADTLDVGQSESHDFDYLVTENSPNPVLNEVTASGSGVTSGEPVDSTANCSTDILHPEITVTKSGEPFAHEGDTITYTITVENTGDEDLTDVTVMDSILGDLSASFADDMPVGTPPESHDFPYVVQEGSADLVNVVTATGVGVTSEEEVSSTATCSTDILHPAIQIVKTVDEDLVPVGTTVTYTYVITNTGDTTLYDVSVDDDIMGHIGDIPVLEPGAENAVTMTKDFVVGVDPVTNVATATGEDIDGRVVSATDDAVVTPIAGENPPPPTPFTGSDAGRLGLIAMALLGLGATLVAVTRRRRTQENTASSWK
jgi:uncharacterized repeat protein (TIGR01451 family)